ncbi:MAG: hypothetical protein ACI4CC_05720 [Lachnospiraceae bacterium]
MKGKTYKNYGRKIAAVVMALCLCIGSLSMAPAMHAEAGYWLSTIYADSWSDINKINSSTSNKTNIVVYLTENVTQTKSLNVSWHNLTINLNGHTLRLNRSVYATGHSIVINGSGTVEITQSTSTGCMYARSGGLIQINSGVTVRKGNTGYTVCALGASSNSTLEVKSGATITGFNYGAYLGSGSTMGLYGTISSCTVDGVRGYGTLNMYSGAAITNCSGDGVDLSGGSFNMSGGKISGGKLYNRYGVRVSSGSKVNFSGNATVVGNKGGNVYVPNGCGNNVTVSGNVNLGFTSNVYMTQGQKVQIASGLVQEITSDNSRYIITQESGCTYLEAPKPSCSIGVASNNAEMGTVAMNGLDKASATVKYNNTVTLTATVTDSVKYEFTGWKNKSGSIVSTSSRYSFPATTDDTYTAIFDKRTYTVKVQLANTSMSSMGRVSASKYSAKYGETVTLTAAANSGYVFKQWNDGDTNASRNITVTGNMTYSAAFSNPPPSATATGYIYTNIRKYTTAGSVTGSVGGYVMIPKSLGQTLPQGESVAIAGLPNGSAIGVVGGNVVNSNVSSAYSGKYFSNGSPKLYLTFIQKASSGFDGCGEGGAAYFGDLGGWLYWCSGGSAAGSVLFDVYAYQTRTEFKAGDIAISRDTEKYSVSNNGGTDTISSSDIIPTVKVGSTTYTLTSYSFSDNGINYETGDKTVSLDLGGVLCTYDFPEAVVDGVEYTTLEEAIKAAGPNKPVEVVTPYVSAITEDVQLNGGTQIIQYNGNVIEAGENSKIQADADGTIELSDGTLNVTPKNGKETVKVDGGSVTSASQIQVTKKDGQESVITNQNQDAQITISPDGDPNHTATFNGCDINKTYGIKQSPFTSEDSIEVSPGTDYTVTTTIEDGEEETPVTVKTDENNTGSTVYTKDGDNLKIENSGNGDMLTIKTGEPSGEKSDPFTTQSDKTTLTVGPDKSTEEDTSDTQISLEKGGVTVPVGDSVVLPGGEKIANTGAPQTGGSEEGGSGSGEEGGSEGGEGGNPSQPKGDPITIVIPENEDGSKQDPQITIPDGSGADIDGQKVFVPSGENGINDDAKVTLKPDGDLGVEVGPGSKVGIGDDEFTAGDYGSDLAVGKDGGTTLKDGDVVLGPGSSITDGNGVTYTYPEEGGSQAVITANDGDKTNVELAEKDTIVYQPEGEDPVEYSNPGDSDADFDLDPDKGMAAASELSLGKGSELNLSADGNSIKIKVPTDNKESLLVDGSANSVTIQEVGDKVQIGNTTYKATEEDTSIEVGAEHNALLSGGVELPKGADVVFNNTQITSVDAGVKVSAEQQDGVPTGKGKVTVPAGKQFALGEDGKKVTFKNPKNTEATYDIDEAGDLHLPSGEEISFKTGKDTTVVSVETGNTDGAKINSVDGNVTVTTQEKGDTITVNGHSYKSTGITMSNEDGSVEDPVMELTVTPNKDVVITRGQAQVDANETISIFDNDGNLVKVVNNTTDPSTNPIYVNSDGAVTVPNAGTDLTVGGMRYTTTEDDTILNATTKGGQLTQGSVEFGKNNAVIANDVIVKNLGSGKLSVQVNDEDDADPETGKKSMVLGVPSGGSFSLTSVENPAESYSFTNPAETEGERSEYTVDKDGNLLLLPTEALSSKINGKDFAFSSNDDTVKLLPTSEGMTATVGAGKSLTINDVTYTNTDTSAPMTIIVDKNGNVILKQGTAKVPAGASINIKKEDGSLLTLKNETTTEEGDEESTTDVTISPDGSVSIPSGATLKAGESTFTSTGNDGVEMELGLDGENNKLVSGTDLSVTNGNIDLGDGKPTISTTGDKPVHISSPASGQPSVEVEPGGNASFTKKTSSGEQSKTVEVSVPKGNDEKQTFDFTGAGTIETEVKEGQPVVMGGVTYTAGSDGKIAVDDEDGSYESYENNDPEATDDSIQIAIDSKNFDKENYEMKVPQGTAVTVDGVEYRSEECDITLSGNPNGKPIVQIPCAGNKVSIGEKEYTAANDDTRFAISGTNAVTLKDNGSTESPSALIFTGNTPISVDGVRFAGNTQDDSYTVTYGKDADQLQVQDGSKISVNLVSNGKKIQVMGESKVGSKDAKTVSDVIFAAKSAGAAFVIDHSSQNEDGTYETAVITASGRTQLQEVRGSDGKVSGYMATVQEVSNREPESAAEESTADESNAAGSTVTVPVNEDSTVEISAVVTEDTVVVETIEKSKIEQIVQEQLENTTSEKETVKITLDLSKTATNSVTVTIPTLENVLETIKTNEKVENEFSINMDGGEITLDTVAMEAIVEQANDSLVEFKVGMVSEGALNSSQEESLKDYEVVKVYETTVSSNGIKIHNFNSGKVQVAIEFTIPEGTDKHHYHVYYVDTNGEMTRYATKYSDGKLYYTTTHFSEYAIVYDKKMKNETEEDPEEEITRTQMYLRQTKATSKSITLKWNQVKDADGYRIWIKDCSSGKSGKLLKNIGSGKTVSYTALNLKSGKCYRFTIYAYKMVDGKRVVIGESRMSVHAVTLGGNYTNPAKVSVNTTSVSLGVGKTRTLKVTVSKTGTKKLTGCVAKVRYLTTDSAVAKVSKSGKITAVSKGTCYVYAIAANGISRKVKVTVK